MHSWPRADVPTLPGSGLPLRLHDTSTGEVRATAPGAVATIYVCGITPYDATHLGHAATYVTFDLVQRVWLDAGHDVHYVQNVTDVDDPLLARALETGDDWMALADRETQLFREDMTDLNVIPPQDYDFLYAAGVKGIYGPGTPIPQSAQDVLEHIKRARAR